MTSPLSAAMDVTQLSKTWCETCDPRLLSLTKKTLANDQLLSKQLTFKMNTEAPSEKPHGAFHIDRLYCAGFLQQDLQDYHVFIKKETNGHLLHMATSFLKVSNFSSHRVKFVRGMTEEMQQIIDKSRIVLDQVPAPPAMILDVVRPSRDQIQEELRRCHKQLPPDESGEDTSQDATSQLGKAYLNEDVFLKQRVTIWLLQKW